MKVKLLNTLFLLLFSVTSFGQDCYWQQKVMYEIEVDFDSENHQFKGNQKVTYLNSSPDTLNRIYFHLYFNAFQPGSMMDVRSRNITDPDPRIKDRIGELKEDEIGYHKIKSIKQGKEKVKYRVEGTILIVELNTPLAPLNATQFNLEFESQVPIQIRRSGRDNREGIAYSMSQWYPKVAEYDKDGWHPNPYVGREFHGVWGDFDVKITIDKEYTLGGTGILQNAQSIGKNYEDTTIMLQLQKGDKTMWHFKAENVHDFVWAADKNYLHTRTQVPNGPTLHFLFKNDTTIIENWNALRSYTVRCFQLMEKLYGPYPYEQYSVIQAGDGGMEYPMATLITGGKKLGSLISVMVHESIHSWFQGMLATNEAKYAWMDEGFTSYAQRVVLDSLYGKTTSGNTHSRSYSAYFRLVNSGLQEPLTTHADHFNTNAAYGTAAYSMGEIFLHQLSYVIGQNTFDRGMKNYFNAWKFKHPEPSDFKKIMEKESGIELDWYFDYWISTTKTIDYGIEKLESKGNSTLVFLKKIGNMPMPLDVEITFSSGETKVYNIPLRMMYGSKKADDNELIYLESWPWTYNSYYFEVDSPKDEIEKIVIDPSERMADVERDNNIYPLRTRSFWGKLKK